MIHRADGGKQVFFSMFLISRKLNSNLFFFLGAILPVLSAICIGAFSSVISLIYNGFFLVISSLSRSKMTRQFSLPLKPTKRNLCFFLDKIKSSNHRIPSTYKIDLILHTQIGRSERRTLSDVEDPYYISSILHLR